MNVTQDIALIPRDGFFCKDGRGWHTSSTGRGHALDWPWPSTILGALRTASGRDMENSTGGFSPAQWQAHAKDVSLSHLLALRRPVDAKWSPTHRVWPVPLDALWLEGETGTDGKSNPKLFRLKPHASRTDEPRTIGRDVSPDDGLREALWFPEVEEDAKPLSRPRWWEEDAFVNWLAGEDANVPAETPKWAITPIRRTQTRVGVDPKTLTAEDAFLFSHDVIETLDRLEGDATAHEWAIGARVGLPQRLIQKTARLGSDSRLAWIDDEMSANLFDPPEDLLEAFETGSPGLRLVVVTPARFQNGWLPSGFTEKNGEFRGQLRGIPSSDVVLRAAFVTRPLHISGWNMIGGGRDMGRLSSGGAPKETQRLVAPGAVYFFERVDKTPFTRADAEKLWLAGLGARTKEGFGRVTPGVWNPQDANPKEQ